MKALLINPHKLIPRSFNIYRRPAPPLGLAYIAATIEKEGFSVHVFDCLAEGPDDYFPLSGFDDILVNGIAFGEMFSKLHEHYDLIGVSLMFSKNWLVNRELINLLKKKYPNALIIAGGEHASAIPEYTLQDCAGLDMVVSGEGEDAMTEVCQKFKLGDLVGLYNVPGTFVKHRKENNKIIGNIKKKRILEIDEIADPAWHLFPLDKYFTHNFSYGVTRGRNFPMLATRGCPYSCTFCSSPQMWGTKYLMREVDAVVDEIKRLNSLYEVTNIDFMDLTAIIKKEWILQFCNRLLEEKLNITWQLPSGTRAEAIDFEVAEMLKKAGCAIISYAPESGSDRVLKATKKKVKIANMLKSIKESHRAGLVVKLNIMIGMPDETIGDILKTYWFLVKASYYGAIDAAPSIFNAYPGSALFQELQDKKELTLSEDYFMSIVYSQSFHGFVNYNRNYEKKTMIALLWGGFLVFYTSNFLFRPWRALKSLYNVLTGNYKTLGEAAIIDVFKTKQDTRKLSAPIALEEITSTI